MWRACSTRTLDFVVGTVLTLVWYSIPKESCWLLFRIRIVYYYCVEYAAKNLIWIWILCWYAFNKIEYFSIEFFSIPVTLFSQASLISLGCTAVLLAISGLLTTILGKRLPTVDKWVLCWIIWDVMIDFLLVSGQVVFGEVLWWPTHISMVIQIPMIMPACFVLCTYQNL